MNWREESQRTTTHQEFPKKPIRSSHRKPPSGFWQQSVPSWEKQFCTSMLIPWRKLCETKKVMSLYNGIVQWNDSAGEEAFCNAKKRFWAKINGFPCDISPPNPDIYIDEINWDSSIDPDLVSALDQETVVADAETDREYGLLGNGLESLFLKNWANEDTIEGTGWGETDDAVRPVNDSAVEIDWGKNAGNSWENGHDNSWDRSGRENGQDDLKNPIELGNGNDKAGVNVDENSWDRRGWMNVDDDLRYQRDWEDGKEHQWNQSGLENVEDNSWNSRDVGNVEDNSMNRTGRVISKDNVGYHGDWQNCGGNSWKQREGENVENKSWSCRRRGHENNELRFSGYWQTGKGNCGKRDGVGGFGSRYNNNNNNSRLPSGEECRINGGWRNCRGRRRTGFGHEGHVFNERMLVPGHWN